MKRVAVLTSGGDAPGMNAAIRAVVRTGIGPMPPYDGKLTAEQIEAVAAFIAKATGAQ